MSYFFLVVCILALEGAVVVVSQDLGKCIGRVCQTDSDCRANEQCLKSPCGLLRCTAVQTLTCANVLCVINSTCLYVAKCSTCPIQPRCIPFGEIYDGINDECRSESYTEAVLVENTRNTSLYPYSPLKCSQYQSCPTGSACAAGVCCRGKVQIPQKKPGLCPTGRVSLRCREKHCTNDYQCPGEQKCCSRCRRCMDPIFVETTEECANIRCQQGEVCVLRPQYCPPDRDCTLPLLLVCVPYQCAKCGFDKYCTLTSTGYTCSKTNECGGCERGKVCKDTGLPSVTTPGITYVCVPVDRCGGCLLDETCKLNTCITDACATYKCYPYMS